MLTMLFVLVVWTVASIPFALCIGWFCGFNERCHSTLTSHTIAHGRLAQPVGKETRNAVPHAALLSPMRP